MIPDTLLSVGVVGWVEWGGVESICSQLFEDCDFVTGDLGFAATMSGLQEAPVENLCAATARPPHPHAGIPSPPSNLVGRS